MSNGFFTKTAAAAIALLLLNSVAFADGNGTCTTATLRGSYGVKVHAQALGILVGTPPSQALHRYIPPNDIDAVALATFYGNGTGTQEDFAMVNGSVRPGSPSDAFVPNEMLTYSVNADCTGQLSITFPTGVTLTQQIIVLDNGNEIFGVTSYQHVPSGAPAHDGTSCTAGCDIAIQGSAHFVKVRQSQDH